MKSPRRSTVLRAALFACGLLACNSVNGSFDLATDEADAAATEVTGSAPNPSGRLDGGSRPNVGITVSAPDGLELGELVCGATSAPRSLVVANGTKADITFETWVGAGATFVVSPPTGAVAAGKTITLGVTANIPALGPVGERAGVISVTTNFPGDAPHELDVGVRVVGAVFKIEPTGKLDFGRTRKGTKQITVRNDGNILGTLNLSSSSSYFDVTPNTSIPLDPNASATRLVVVTPPRNNATQNATLSGSTTAVHCGPLPSIAMTARGFDND